jgi:hypothetical protein
LWSAPPAAESDVAEIVQFAYDVGIDLDDWQRFVFEHAMGTRDDDSWAARSVGVCVPRQNGKTLMLGIRALYGVIVLGERLVVHTAQLSPTAVEQFRIVADLVDRSPVLRKRLASVDRGRGNERIEFANGGRIVYRARSGLSLRGLSIDCVILDEAMYLDEATMAAVQFALSARPNAQLWYAGSAVDQLSMKDGVVFARVRENGIAGSPRLAYFEWSMEGENPQSVTREQAGDPVNWARANPAFGSRILPEVVETEFAERDVRTFLTERGGVGDWPRTDGGQDLVIPLEEWDACLDAESVPLDPVWLAVDVDPDRNRATVAVAGRREDGLLHVEVIEHFRAGTAGLLGYLVERYARHDAAGVVCDAASPAATLLPDLKAAGLWTVALTASEFARSCGAFVDSVTHRTVRHRGGELMRDAIRAAAKRPLTDSWAWSRKNSASDITPLVAPTLALWAASTAPPPLDPDLYAQSF